ncbi:MAG: hypothetical protein JJE09_06430, partial [Bacteroidia bacterium]|nr:hypothetical protein [Bacteroidia bacterium]
MMKPINSNQAILIFLTSSVLACLGAAMLAGRLFNLLSFPLSRQILIIALLWFSMGMIFYLTISMWSAHDNGFRAFFAVDLTLNIFVRKAFLAFFLVFPMGLILYQHISEIIQIWTHGRTTDFTGWSSTGDVRLLLIIVLIIILILIVFIMSSKSYTGNYLDGLPDKYYVLFILCITLLARLPSIYLINTQPTSDFLLIHQDAVRISQGILPTEIYVSTNVAVTMIYGFLYKIFVPELIVVKFFHTMVYGLSGVFIFYAGKQIFKNKFWAGICGLLLVSWPSLVLYSNVLTPEHLFILVECALLFAVSLFFKNQKSAHAKGPVDTRGFFMFPLIGFLLGLMGFFRPFSELFLAAFIVTLFLWNPGLKTVIWNVLGIFTVFIVFWLLNLMPEAVAKSYNSQLPNIRPCNLLVGLNVESMGLWNMEDYYICRQIRLQADDQAEYAREVLDVVVERLEARQNQLLPFINKKFAILWQNSTGILLWTIQTEPTENSVSTIDMVQKVNVIDFALMFIGTLACLAGTVIAFFKDVKPVIFFGLVAFLGFNLMEIVFEVQTRYRTVVMPLFILFACWTFSTFYTSININP